MVQFRLAENLIQYRRKKGITQEKLADFLGVSKASVSKWETGQSLPDILQLPRLAAFYGVTIDEMIGYEQQLSVGDVTKHYARFAEEFAEKGAEETVISLSRTSANICINISSFSAIPPEATILFMAIPLSLKFSIIFLVLNAVASISAR